MSAPRYNQNYTFHFWDLSSKTYIDGLPVESATYASELRGAGTATGTIPLYDPSLAAQRVLDATIPERTVVGVERGNALVWMGRVVPTRDYDSTTGRLTINAEECVGTFDHREMPTLSLTGTDQLDIARQIITAAQSGAGGDLWITASTGTSGVTRDMSWAATDHTSCLAALTDLSEMDKGFEWCTRVQWDANRSPVQTLLLGYPRVGQVAPAYGALLAYDRFGAGGGNIASFTWSEGAGMATQVTETTDTDDGVHLEAVSTNQNLLDTGWPRLEVTANVDGVSGTTAQADLQAAADALAAKSNGIVVTATAIVRGGPGFAIGGDWMLGDDLTARISDFRHPPKPNGSPGWVGTLRVVGYETTVGVEGAETYSLTLADFNVVP